MSLDFGMIALVTVVVLWAVYVVVSARKDRENERRLKALEDDHTTAKRAMEHVKELENRMDQMETRLRTLSK